VLGNAVTATGDRETFLGGIWDGEQVHVLDRQSAASQARLAATNVLVRMHAGSAAMPAGALATILDF